MNHLMLWLLAATEKVDPNSIGISPVNNANSVVSNVLNTTYMWAGIICVLIIIIGGYFYTTANGDAAQIKRGKNAVIGAVAGLVVILMAFVITAFILDRLG